MEALLSTIIGQLTTFVQQEIEQEVSLVVGVKKDVDKISKTLARIQTVLKEAEMKQIEDDSVRDWLQELKDVAYDINDVLDEWMTEILKSQISLTKKVCLGHFFSPCFCFKKVALHHHIGHKIKDLSENVDRIERDQPKFDCSLYSQIIRNCEMIDDVLRRRILETSSLDVDVKEVFGRNQDQDIIISKLLSEGSQLSVISITGMAGLGKTTLAQIVFNDDRVKNHFSERMWIHVSKHFDREKVAKNIIRKMGGTHEVSGYDITWEALQCQLTRLINGKQFLLVLDDVWNEDSEMWDPLRISLQCGPQVGSRILVTTRNENVALMMRTTYVHRLGVLSDQDCWSLLSHYAFDGRQKEECEMLKEIGIELANKCHGLPLSAKTLGSLLRLKESTRDWRRVSESDVWTVVSSADKPILPALLLSYIDLPSYMRQCFAYCSLPPRGCLIAKNLMIKEWMAQGFLDSQGKPNDDLIAVGDKCFNELALRSLFEKDAQNSRSNFQCYRLHDLVYDFARSLVEKECFTLTIEDTNAQEFDLSRARHLYLLVKEIKVIPSYIYKAKNVRTLKINGQIPSISLELFNHLKCLRTLDLSDVCLEKLPNEIKKLIHLRWLNLSGAKFKELPKTVTHLCNLKGLCLYGCINLCKLPEGIERLINLIELDLTECRRISYLPKGIGKLTKLCHLSDFIIGGVERGRCNIGELEHLNFLNASLRIIGLGRVENGDEAKMACLKKKEHLRALYFYFDQCTGVSLVDEDVHDEEGEEEEKEEIIDGEGKTEEVVDGEVTTIEEEEATGGEDMLSRRMEDVLESLQPNPNLEKLIIWDYLGAEFPKWMVSHADFMSFSNLIFLDLRGWRKCKQLPPTIGKLPSLETLAIANMEKVKLMGIEFFAMDGGTRSEGGVHTIFPKLKVFQLNEMWNLEEWDMGVQNEDGKEFFFMPCLQYLILCDCTKLRRFPQHLMQATSLRKLFIWNCPKLEWEPSPFSHLPSLPIEELILKEDAGSFSKSLLEANNRIFLPKLKLLRVRQSPYSSLPQGLGQLTSLEILDIRTCSKIKSIPEEEFQHLTALKELKITRCPALRRRCQKEIGEDWSKISHIPKISIDQKN